MWSKFSNALKRQDDTDAGSQYQEQHHANASTRSLATSYHESTAILSPPSSPSKKKNMLKRLSRATNLDDAEGSSSPFKLPIGLPKRVKSHLNLHGNGALYSIMSLSIGLTSRVQALKLRYRGARQTLVPLRIPYEVIKTLCPVNLKTVFDRQWVPILDLRDLSYVIQRHLALVRMSVSFRVMPIKSSPPTNPWKVKLQSLSRLWNASTMLRPMTNLNHTHTLLPRKVMGRGLPSLKYSLPCPSRLTIPRDWNR